MENFKKKSEPLLRKLDKEYIGEAGGGIVRVVMTRDLYIKDIEIDHTMFADKMPELFDDLNFISDLFKAAVNQAINKSIEDMTSKMFQRGLL